jgi:hypothetical protein
LRHIIDDYAIGQLSAIFAMLSAIEAADVFTPGLIRHYTL